MINDELLCIVGKVGKPTFSQESEIMAKIMIDISMNKLVDASTLDAEAASVVLSEAQ